MNSSYMCFLKSSVKDDNGELKFSFDRETVFNLMTDYPEKLTPEQKEIFDKENPYWKVYLKRGI